MDVGVLFFLNKAMDASSCSQLLQVYALKQQGAPLVCIGTLEPICPSSLLFHSMPPSPHGGAGTPPNLLLQLLLVFAIRDGPTLHSPPTAFQHGLSEVRGGSA